ncbi:MAG: protocatechuate 3,4-dioxygenase [Pseudomonadota bacterium]
MAKITLGICTTHGPILNTTPEEWMLRVPHDHKTRHWFRNKEYSFEELVALRKHENFAAQITLEERTRRHAVCQQGVAKLAEVWAKEKPDVAVIMGNDQRELILESMQPAFTIYHGDTFWQKPLDEDRASRLSVGIRETEWAYRPHEPVVWPALPELANLAFRMAADANFDFAASKMWPDMGNHHHIGTPHAFSWIVRRVMNDNPVPILPIITNTFFPPNQPTARRCFEMGRFFAKVIKEWKSDAKVAVFGSGGLTHFTIDEKFDNDLYQAMLNRDEKFLCSVPQSTLMQGTSEIRNWIAAAGVLFETELAGAAIDYIPCYRTEAGTGTAQGFMVWR